MLRKSQFTILVTALAQEGLSDDALINASGLEAEEAAWALASLKAPEIEALSLDNVVTEQGLERLEPYRVRNAVIMAAGMSSRFAPISYERPKGVLTVRGEVLVERQIRQLREAGIEDIYLVLGYKKEEFFYLEDEFNVHIRINGEYLSRNNNSSIRCVADVLDNTYICSSDDYFTSNPFERYVYESYYSAVYEEGETEEYCFTNVNDAGLIQGVEVGGADSWVMMGHVYWDRTFSQAFIKLLDAIYNEPETAAKLWEDIYIDHIEQFAMVMRPYPEGVIWEFDSLDEVSAFDPTFIQNVDSCIFDNICTVLHCERNDITAIAPISQGITNLSFSFTVDGTAYVYRHPGEGTDEIINRESEAFSQSVARELGLDDTFIYEDGNAGWKISRFIEGCHTLDYENWDEVAMAMDKARRLHRCGITSPWNFDIYEETQKIIRMLDERSRTTFKDFQELYDLAECAHAIIVADAVPQCLCHNDFYDPNFLVRGDEMYLIDWEYSGMSDFASDLGTFVCCSPYDVEGAARVYEMYFERPLTKEEERHCFAYTTLSSFYWFVWALYKEACGDPTGEWLYLWYRNTKRFGEKTQTLNAQF